MNVLDLFSGPGGLSIGLQKSGASIHAAIELNRDAMCTYSMHTSEAIHINSDIQSVDFSQFIGKVDFVSGGPPCQPFSLGGLRKSIGDKRNMVPEFIRCIATIKPYIFLMENVPGLTMSGAKPYFETVLRELSELGYKLNWKILNSADFGVPQKRRRLFILGCRDRFLEFPEPTHGVGLTKPHPQSRDFIKNEPKGIVPNSKVKYAKDPDLRSSPFAGQLYNGGGRPIDPNGPCHTILASSGGHKTHWVDTLGVAVEYHAHLIAGGKPREGFVEGSRRLTVEECAVIQTFPHDMMFTGSRSSQYTQVGDAVPPLLAEAIGKKIMVQH
jgi:DNA (cytosine-5)-methyltransferase 1